MTDVMLDLETLGTGSDAAILSVGAVVFDIQAGNVLTDSALYHVVDLQTSLAQGGTVTGETFYWWLEQSEAARRDLTRMPKPIDWVLEEFFEWFPCDARIWANGVDFDVPILASAFLRAGYEDLPWKYNATRDMRTIKWLVAEQGLIVPAVKNFTAHNALQDAITQAHFICKALQILGMTSSITIER